MHYGYIGLGNLGANCAACLRRAGFDMTVHDLNRSLADPLMDLGVAWADSAAELAAQVDHVITCLPSPAATETVLNEMLPQMTGGATWIEMLTLGRDEVLAFSRQAAEHGVRMLELPVTGGVHLAAQGRITMLPGGDEDLVKLHWKAMEAMGDRIYHMGPLGSASIIKVITNMLAFIHLKACGEALMLARRGGLDLGQAWQFGREFGVPLDLAGMTQQNLCSGQSGLRRRCPVADDRQTARGSARHGAARSRVSRSAGMRSGDR